MPHGSRGTWAARLLRRGVYRKGCFVWPRQELPPTSGDNPLTSQRCHEQQYCREEVKVGALILVKRKISSSFHDKLVERPIRR